MQRYLEGEASEQERTKIEAWLDVMKTKNTTDLELSKEDEENLFRKITKKANNMDEVISFLPKQDKKTDISQVMQIAAGLLILISVSYVVWNFANKDSDKLKVTSINGIEKIILNDGTLVWLHKGSSVTYFEKQQDGVRQAQLQGEALFEVAKDPSHPFIIKCGDVSLKVLGTSFSVKTNNDSLQLIVLTGKVNLSTNTNKEGINVEPNEKAIYTKNGRVEKTQLHQTEISTITANTEYNMQFNNTSMQEVAEKISKKFNVEVNINSKQATDCRITADFTDHSLESTLKLITEVLDVSYTQEGNVITISGTGCK